jgi:hypothetical protein
MHDLTPIFVVAIISASIYSIIQLFVKRKERIMLIEKGTNPPEMKSDFMVFSSLKFGLFFVGIGAGVFIANILAVTTTLDQETAYFSMIFLFGGLALVIHHLIERAKK